MKIKNTLNCKNKMYLNYNIMIGKLLLLLFLIVRMKLWCIKLF